jgi:oxygen-independent coproporphyrinogen III oxidase
VKKDTQAVLMDAYMEGLLRDISMWWKHYEKPQVKTLYFGGGTPGILWKERLITIIDHIIEHYHLEFLEEFSIELNPNPYAEILDLVSSLNERYGDIFPRMRYSFGIQSFDNSILQISSRQYSFTGIQHFLRDLREIKTPTMVVNLDFIAFGKGKREGEKFLAWDRSARDWYDQILSSGFVDSVSLYTLELFGGSQWHETPSLAGKRAITTSTPDGQEHLQLGKVPFETNQENITGEFQWLKDHSLNRGFRRYELSNFASHGKESLHNRIYWTMQSYLGFGPSASSFLCGEYARNLPPSHFSKEQRDATTEQGIRFTTKPHIFQYTKILAWDDASTVILSHEDNMIETAFLALRTSQGVSPLSAYTAILENNWESLLTEYQNMGLVQRSDDRLRLTDQGLDLYNTIVTRLVRL